MSSVDDRIVNMQFNSKQFTQGAADSTKALDDLEKAMGNAAKSGGLDALGKGVMQVQQKFGLMRTAGLAAVATIASKATTAGLNFVKSFAFGPIMDGFREYQTNLSSIQTIIANTGKSVPTVNRYLNQLNHYSDMTIYNFGQMADAIGKFTSAGVNLKTSVASIKGMANLAALSGSNVQQLNTAMYQMSQALAAGTIRLQDWNSVVNAGMGGKNLQNALKISARAVGENVDAMIKKTGSFRESLKEGWLTTKVFTNTMKAFSKGINIDQMKTQLSLQGKQNSDVQKAIALAKQQQMQQLKSMGITGKQAKEMARMANAAAASASVVKTFPQLIDVTRESIGSMWSSAFTQIIGNFNQSKKMWTTANLVISSQINTISKHFLGMLKTWADPKNGGRLAFIEGIKNVFKALGGIFVSLKKAFTDVFPPNGAKNLIAFSKGFERLTAALIPSKDTLANFQKIFGGIFSLLHIYLTVTSAIRHAVIAFFEALFSGSGHASGGILDLIGKVGEAITWFDKWLSDGVGLVKMFTNIGTVAGTALHPIIGLLSLLGSAIGSLFRGDLGSVTKQLKSAADYAKNFGTAIYKAISGIQTPLGNVGNLIGRVVTKFEGFFHAFQGTEFYQAGRDTIGGLVSGLLDSASEIKSVIENIATQAIEWFKSVLGIHSPATSMIPIGENIIAGIAKGLVEGAKLLFQGIGKVFSGLMDVIKQLFGSMDAMDIASLMNSLFAGALILAIRNFTKNTGGLLQSLSGIGESIKGTFGQLTDTLKTMQTSIKAQMIKTIAIAVGILTASLIALTFIKVEKLQIALGAIGAMMASLVGSLFAMSKIRPDKMGVLVAALVAMSGAIFLLSTAVAIMGTMDLTTLGKGLGGIAIAMALMIKSMEGMSKVGAVAKSAAVTLVVMATAMNIMALAVRQLGSMSIEDLVKGLAGLAISMALMTQALTKVSTLGPAADASATAILAVSTSMLIMSGAVAVLGRMDLGNLVKGLGAMAVMLATFVVALNALSVNPAGVSAAASSILAIAGAMVILSYAVKTLGEMSLGDLAKGIGAIVITMIAMAAAGVLLAGPLAVLGAALIPLGAAFALAGAGMLAFGTGFAILTAAGTAGIAVLTAGFSALMALLPAFAVQVAGAFVAFIQTVAAASGKLRTAFDTIFKNVIGVITDNIPVIASLFDALIKAALTVINNNIPLLGKVIRTFIDTIFKIARSYFNDLIDLGGDIVVHLFQGVRDRLPKLIKLGGDIIVDFIEGMGDQSVRIARASLTTINKVINGLADAVHENRKGISKGVGRLGSELVGLAGDIIGGLASGIANAGLQVLRDAIRHVVDIIPGWAKKLLGIHSPSTVMAEIGGHVVDGLARGIANSAGALKDKAIDMALALVHGVVKIGGEVIHGTGELIKGAGNGIKKGAGAITGAVTSLFNRQIMPTEMVSQAQVWGEAIANGISTGITAGARKAAPKLAKLWVVPDSVKKGVGSAFALAGSLQAGSGSEARKYLSGYLSLQAAADREAAKAQLAGQDVRRAQAMPKKTKEQQKKRAAAIKRAQARQDKANKRRDAAQAKADAQLQKMTDARSGFDEADNQGKGDYRTQQAVDAGKAANTLLARANEEAKRASQMMKSANPAIRKAGQTLMRQAQRDAAAAKKQADAAKRYSEQANYYYSLDVQTSIDDLKQQEQNRKDQEAFDKADDAGKIKILQDRIPKEQKELDDAQKKYEDNIAAAQRALDAGKVDEAQKYFDEAQKWFDKASQLRDQVSSDTDALNNLLGQSSSGDGTGGGGPVIQIGRSVLEDAAKVIDRYTQSLQDAEELAAGQQPMQLIQNNYSPEALSTAEIYRQTNNIISTANVKMGANG